MAGNLRDSRSGIGIVSGMAILLGAITMDTTDALRLAQWWATQFDGRIVAENDGWYVVVELPGAAPNLAFQRVEAPTPGKNRLHLDLETDVDLDQTAQSLREAGATLVEDRQIPGFRWITLADPDGNEFCVAPRH